MNINVLLMIASLFYLTLISILYFSKKNINTVETKIYKYILISTIFGVIIDIVGVYLSINVNDTYFIRWLVLKLYYSYLLLIMYLLSCYMFIGSNSNKLLKRDKPKFWGLTIGFILVAIINLFLPIKYYKNGNVIYAYGIGTEFLYAIAGIVIVIWIVFLILSWKKITKKNIPMITFILLIVPIILIQKFNPELLLISGLISFVVVIMYHTIENPDMKMLREIQQSKEFAEHANNEKAMFLYNTSQELKMPVKAIEQRCEELLKEQDIKEIINGIKDIKFAAKRLSSTISGTLDMPTTMASNIEIKVSKYSTKLLLKEMESISRLNMKDKNLEFRTSFDDNIPEYLMGDSIRLKQIIATIMNNAIKHTEKGFIEFNVSSVIKHDICRLIITIEDSGAGIESSKLETLFYNTDEIDEEGILKADGTKQSLSVVKILTNLIGGTVIVNSELGKGSKFTVVLDQQIVEEKTSTDIAIEKLSSNKRILIVDDEEESLKQIAKLLNKYDVNVDAVLWGQDCLEKIRKKQKYDLILLDEDMPRLNGIKTFEKLKLEDDFNIPVVIMINEEHLAYKERYSNNGFSSCVVKPLKKQELDKVIKKHLKIDD